MPKASHAILDYATPTPPGGIDRVRSVFWPLVAVLFVAGVMVMAGTGWASAVIQLGTSFALLLLWLAAAYGWGLIPRLILKLPVETPLGRVTTLATGLGILSLLTLGLGLAGGMNQIVAIGITLIGFGVSVAVLLRNRMSVHLRVDLVHWWWLLLVPLASLTITAGMLPAGFLWGMDEPNGYDVVEYHLQVPREWYELGRIVPLTHNVFSFFPFNVEMHYLFAMHLMGGPWVAQFLAQMMHAAFIGLTVAAVYAVVVERGRFVAITAALLAASAPWMPMLGSIAYNEGGLLLYGTLAVAWTMRATTWRHFAIAGLMAGFACGCKLTGVPMLLIAIPAAVLIAHLAQRSLSTRIIGGAAVFVIVGLLTFSPWLLRNYAWTGNPVFPEQQKLLGRGHFTQEQSDRFYKAHKPRPDQAAMGVRVAELGRQVFADWRFAFVILPLGAIAILLSLRQKESQILLVMLIGLTAFWLFMTHLQGRFYVLAIPLAAIGYGQLASKNWARPMAILAMLALVTGTALSFHRLGEFTSRFSEDVMQAIGFTDLDNADRFGGLKSSLGRPIVLVGDAAAYSYHVPMSQLHYRTVFDVNDAGAKTAVEAWTRGLPEDQDLNLWIDPREVERFHRTYGTVDLNQDFGGQPTASITSTRPALRSPSPPAPASAPSP